MNRPSTQHSKKGAVPFDSWKTCRSSHASREPFDVKYDGEEGSGTRVSCYSEEGHFVYGDIIKAITDGPLICFPVVAIFGLDTCMVCQAKYPNDFRLSPIWIPLLTNGCRRGRSPPDDIRVSTLDEHGTCQQTGKLNR